MWSYCGQANLCILADREILGNGWFLYDAFTDELQILMDLVPNEREANTSKGERTIS